MYANLAPSPANHAPGLLRAKGFAGSDGLRG